MNLPDGVNYHWRRRDDWTSLISKGGDGLIRIDDQSPYDRINERSFETAIKPYLKGDWEGFDRKFQLEDPRVVYSGAEHKGNPKLPNITVVPNLRTKQDIGEEPLMVFGCTMGHYHSDKSAEYRVQEVYEFQSYGLMAIDRGQGEIELWVAQDGDKVAVPNQCHMTLYNLGGRDDPLITLDFADPDRNPATKKFASKYGPVLLAYYDDSEVIFRLNKLYINNPEHQAGVRLCTLLSDLEGRQVRIPFSARLDLGRHLYEQLTRNPDVIGQFARLGMRIRLASPEAVLEPVPPKVLGADIAKSVERDLRIHFNVPLIKATKPGTRVYRYFFSEATEAQPDKARRNIAEEEEKRTPHLLFDLERLNRPLMIVVEGAGDWVQKAYRPVFQGLARRQFGNAYNVSVIYADDTRWTGSSPDFVNYLEDWEIYLDKAKERDLTIYQNLVPDVVLVVTPDFTHSEIAQSWIGKVPLILVEKPFDSHLANVDKLVRALGRSQQRPQILGLDHFRFYAIPLRKLLPTVVDHLGEALKQVIFYLTESMEINPQRQRSLQHGLTLDLLPHFSALLLFFGDLYTVDAISVIKAGQYAPLPLGFKRETASYTTPIFEDYSGNRYPVPCKVVVGKGFKWEAKYLEITGINDNAIRIDFGREGTSIPASWPKGNIPDPYDRNRTLSDMYDFQGGYRKGSIFFLQGPKIEAPPGTILTVTDPYNPNSDQPLHIREDLRWKPIDQKRYESLFRGLLEGGEGSGFAGTMSFPEAYQVMVMLERIWRAVQADWPDWKRYPLGEIAPVYWAGNDSTGRVS